MQCKYWTYSYYNKTKSTVTKTRPESVICGGQIRVSLDIEQSESDYYHNISSSLAVGYSCSRCGATPVRSKEAPNSLEDIGTIVQEFIDKLE